MAKLSMGVVNTPLPARPPRRKKRLVSLSLALIVGLGAGLFVWSRAKPAPAIPPSLQTAASKVSQPKTINEFSDPLSTEKSAPAPARPVAAAARSKDDL